MRVLVCGGRNYTDQACVFEVLTKLQDIELIIEGGAEGADRQARYWALANGVPCMTIHAAWNKLGRSAGHVRNGWMLRFGLPDLVVAFPGGVGTDNMCEQAVADEVKVVRISE